MTLYTCHPKLVRRLRSGGLKFQASSGKKVHETSSQWKKLDVIMHACHPSNGRKCKIGNCSPGKPGQKVRPYLQNNQSKKD
jgi:hypothetical protein